MDLVALELQVAEHEATAEFHTKMAASKKKALLQLSNPLLKVKAEDVTVIAPPAQAATPAAQEEAPAQVTPRRSRGRPAAAAVAESPATAPTAVPAAPVDAEAVRQKLLVLAQAKNIETVRGILKQFNAEAVRDLAPDNFAAVVRAADAAMAV